MVEVSSTAVFWLLAAAVLFALFSGLRFSLNLGIIERPLVQGLIWGLVTGNVPQAVSLALVFELFWLDLIPAGTFIPPNTAAANMAAQCLVTVFGFQAPAEMVFPVLLSFPLAWIGTRVEQAQRRWQDNGYNILQSWLMPGRNETYSPGVLVRRALVQSMAANFLFFLLTVTLTMFLTSWLLSHGLLRPPSQMFTWGHLWITATLGGLMALKVPGAYVVLAFGGFAVAALSLFI